MSTHTTSNLAADHVKHVERLWRTVKSIQATTAPETPLAVSQRNYRDLTRALYIVKAAKRGGRAHALHLRSHDERMALEEKWEEQVAGALDGLLPQIDIDAAWHEAHRGWPNFLDPSDGIVIGEIGVMEALLANTLRKAGGEGEEHEVEGKPRKDYGTKTKATPADMKVIEGWGGQRSALAKKVLKSDDFSILRLQNGVPYAVAEMERATGNITVRTLVVSPEAQHHGQDALREIAIEAADAKAHMSVHPRNPAQSNYLARLGFVKNVPLPPAAGAAAGSPAFTPAAEQAMMMTLDALTQVVQQNGFSPFPQTRAGVQAALASGVNYDDWARGAYSRYIGMAAQTAEQAGQMSMDQLGLNKTFAFAHPQNMARDMFGVRGSKIVQQMYGEHMNKLTQIIMDATAPKSPLSIQEVTKRIKAEWPKLTKYQAVRIARTETAAVWMHTALNAYAANGVSEWESIVAKGPSIEVDAQGACGFCGEMAAHTHSMDDIHLPPYHPHCRCDVVPVLEDPTTGDPWLPPDEPWAGGDELGVSAGLPGVGKLVAAPEPGVPLGGPLTFTSHVIPKPAERAALKAEVQAWPEHVPGGGPTSSIKVKATEMLDSPVPIKAMRTGLGNVSGIASYQDGFMLPNMGHTILVYRIETATGDRYAMLRGFAEDAYRGKADYLAIATEWLPAATRKRLTAMGFEPVPYQPGIVRLRTAELPERFKFDPTAAESPAPLHVPPPVPDAPPLIPVAPPPPPPKLVFEEVTDVAAFNAKLATSPYKDFITLHSPEEIKAAGTRMWMSKDGNVTFSVTRSGDIQNVAALPGAPKGVGGQAVEEAIRQGGTHLDAYDNWLPDFYAKYGFKATGHMRWIDEYAPDAWDYAKFGRPDVVFMSLAKEGTEARLAAKVLFEDWDAAKGWSKALGGGATIKEAKELAFAESALGKLPDGPFYLTPLGGIAPKLQRYRVVEDGSELVLDGPVTTADLAAYYAANLTRVEAKGKLKSKLFFQGWTDEAGRVHLGVGTSFRQLNSAKAFAVANDGARVLDTKTGEYIATKYVGPAELEPLPSDVASWIHQKGLDHWPPDKGAKSIEILGDKSDTVALYTKNGAWAQEREALHQDIIHRHFEGKVEATGQPTVYLTSGGGASGKSNSTFRVGDKDMTLDALKASPDVVVIDPDAIKAMLPEYQEIVKAGDVYASFAVHEESKALARAVKKLAQQRGYNIVLDTTGSGKTFISKLQSFREAGYRVEVTMTSVPTREAVIRSVLRGGQTGRYVAVHALSRAHREASRAFAEWKNADYVDEWRLYDNTAGRVLVAEKKLGQEIKVYDEAKLKAIQHKAVEPDIVVPAAPEPPTPTVTTTVTPMKELTDFDEVVDRLTTETAGWVEAKQVDDLLKVMVDEAPKWGLAEARGPGGGLLGIMRYVETEPGVGLAAPSISVFKVAFRGNDPDAIRDGIAGLARVAQKQKADLFLSRLDENIERAFPSEMKNKGVGLLIATDDLAAKFGLKAKPSPRPTAPTTVLEDPPAPLSPDGPMNATSVEADDAIKVYTAESDLRDKLGPGTAFSGVDDAGKYAEEVWGRNKDLWQGNITRPEYIDVRQGDLSLPNHSELSYVSEGGATIYPVMALGKNMQDQLTVLHETAHALFGPHLQNDIGHGYEFQALFVQLLRRELPKTYADGLEARLGLQVAHVPKTDFATAPPVKDWAWADGEVRRSIEPVYAPSHPEWVSGLSGSQREAIKSWTEGTEAAGINIDIRAGKLLKPSQEKQADAMDRFIAAAPEYEEPVTVWRGITLDGTFEGIDNAALEARLLKEFPVGATLKPAGYQATSFDAETALMSSMNADNFGMVFEIRTKRGALLKDVSSFKDEDELLLSRNEVWEVKRVTHEVFEQDGKQVERYVVQVEAKAPEPVVLPAPKLSPEPYTNNVTPIPETGINAERADWLGTQVDGWSIPAATKADVSDLLNAAESGGTAGTMGNLTQVTRLIELRDEYSRLRGLAGVDEYEGATFAKSILTVTRLFPDSTGNLLAAKQMINTAANLARAHYATLRIDSSKVFLTGDEWDDLALWAKTRGFSTDDVYWSAKVDDLVAPMRLGEAKQPEFGWVPPKVTPMSPEVIGGLHVEVQAWPAAANVKDMITRAAQDKKMSLKAIRDDEGNLESLAATQTVVDGSGKPVLLAEVHTSTGEPYVDIFESLADDAESLGARLVVKTTGTSMTHDTLHALGMKRLEGTAPTTGTTLDSSMWVANVNDLSVVRVRAAAAAEEGKPLYGDAPKPVPEAEPSVIPMHPQTYESERVTWPGKKISSYDTTKLEAEILNSGLDPNVASKMRGSVINAGQSLKNGVVVVRDADGKIAATAVYVNEPAGGGVYVRSLYSNRAPEAEDEILRMFARISEQQGTSKQLTFSTAQWDVSTDLRERMLTLGFDDVAPFEIGMDGALLAQKLVGPGVKQPPLFAAVAPPPPKPLEVVQMEGASANPDVLDALREEAGKWTDAKRATSLLEDAETFPSLAIATIRTADGKLDGLVGFAEWSDMKRIGIVDNLVMRNSDDFETTEALLAIPARRAFDRGWKMTIQSVNSADVPTIDLTLKARFINHGAKEIDAGASGKYLEFEAKDLGTMFDIESVKYGVPAPTAAVPGVQKLPTPPEALAGSPPATSPYGGADLSDAPPKVEVTAFTDQPMPSTTMTDTLLSVEKWTEAAAKKDAMDLLAFVKNQDGVGLMQVRKGDFTNALAAYSYADNNVVVHQLVSPYAGDLAGFEVKDALAAELKLIFGLMKMGTSPPRGLVFDTSVALRKDLRETLEAMGFKQVEYTDPTYGPVRVFGITNADIMSKNMIEKVPLPEASPLLRAETGLSQVVPEGAYTPLSQGDLSIAKHVEDGDFPPVTPGGITKEAGTSKMSKDLTEGVRDRGVVGLKQDVADLIDSRLRGDPGWHPEVVKDMYDYSYARYSQDASKDVIAQLVNNWAITSSDADWRSVAIQIVTKEELGLGDVRVFAASYRRLADEDKNLKVIEEAMRKLDDNPALRSSLRAFVRAQYEETQRYLKDLGVDEVTIYRGLTVNPSDPAVPWGVGLSVTPATDNPIASWSFRHNTARRSHFFGGTMLRASVPREMIFSFPRTGFGCADMGEAEVLVINTGHNRVWVSQEGDLPLDAKALSRLGAEKETIQAQLDALQVRVAELNAMNDGAGPAYGASERQELYDLREQSYPLSSRIQTIDNAFQRGSMRYEYERETELRQLIEQALTEDPSLAGKVIKPPGWTAQQWKSVGALREQVEALTPDIERMQRNIIALREETDAGAVDAAPLIARNLKELKKLVAQQEKIEAKIEAIEEAVRTKATGYTVAEAKEADKLRNMISGLDEQIVQIKAPSVAASYVAEREALQAKLTAIEEKVAARVAAKVVSPAVAKAKAEITSLKRKISNRKKKIETEYERGFNPEANLQLAGGERITFKDWLESKGKAEYEELPNPSPSPLDAGKTLYVMKTPPIEVMAELMASGEVLYPPWWWQRVNTYRKQVENLEGQLARAEGRLADAQAAAIAKARYTEGMSRLRKRAGL